MSVKVGETWGPDKCQWICKNATQYFNINNSLNSSVKNVSTVDIPEPLLFIADILIWYGTPESIEIYCTCT